MNFEALRYPKFRSDEVKILLITSKYFLIGEFVNALRRLGISFESIVFGDREYLTEDFLSILTSKIKEFKPDFTFTINHLGIDREGVLMSLFEKIEMPIISWYVDNPNLIIKYFQKNVSDYCCLLVWDKDNIEDMKKIGFKHVFYLPLGTDTERFRKIELSENPYKSLKTDVSFVGKSMIDQVKKTYSKTLAPESFKKNYRKIAVRFCETDERSVADLMKKEFPELYSFFEKLDQEAKTYFETTVVWEATRIYRYRCIKEIVRFTPLIIGDRNWKRYFRDRIKYFPEVNYYEDLPYIYNLSTVNFNTTSMQMKNAVNQRVFDVPACQSFLITDYRKQIEDLFEVGKEVVCYRSFEEIPYIVEKYLKDEKERMKVVKRAYERILNEHTYLHRAKKVIEIAKNVYS